MKEKFKTGDHVVTNDAYASLFKGGAYAVEGELRSGFGKTWLVQMHHPVLPPQQMHQKFLEKFTEEHMGTLTHETVRLAGFTWTKTDRNLWLAKEADARIRVLDPKTYAVYRGGRYLGSEATIELAAERAKTNELSKANKVKIADAPPVVVEAGVRVKAEAKAVRAKARTQQEGGRSAELLALLKRGCTREEVLRVTGWKAVSMQAMAKTLGVGLRIDNATKPYKYFSEEK